MSQTADNVPARTKFRVAITNVLQKYRGLLIIVVAVLLVVVAGVAVWTQIDAASQNAFAAKIEKTETDFGTWMLETDKKDAAATLEADLTEIEKSAPAGYGLSKAWFIHGNYFASQKKWSEAADAFHKVFDKDRVTYLAPIALVNAAVAREEAGDTDGALKTYAEFEAHFATDALLAPQVFFTQGRLLESQSKTADALKAYNKLLQKFPESDWTKLGRDRILLLSRD